MKTIKINLELSEAQAMALSKIAGGLGLKEIKQLASSEAEATRMRLAVRELVRSLSRAGYKPRYEMVARQVQS